MDLESILVHDLTNEIQREVDRDIMDSINQILEREQFERIVDVQNRTAISELSNLF